MGEKMARSLNVKRWNNKYAKSVTKRSEVHDMLQWALIFLVVALIAGLLGFTGVAGTAANIAWILFVVGLVVALVLFIMGRRPRL